MKYLCLLILPFLFFACNKEEKHFEEDLEAIQDYIDDKGYTAISTASGLHYVIVNEGTGTEMPDLSSEVSVTYRGEFLDGDIFDFSTSAIEFPLTNVIAGWTEGLQLMKKGATHYLLIPSRLAYGEEGRGDIPKHTPLFFEVTLFNFN